MDIQDEKLMADFTFMHGAMINEPINFYDKSIGDKIETWHWNFGDNNTSHEQHPIHSYGKPGSYCVTLTISAKQQKVSITKQITIIVTNKPVLIRKSDSNLSTKSINNLQISSPKNIKSASNDTNNNSSNSSFSSLIKVAIALPIVLFSIHIVNVLPKIKEVITPGKEIIQIVPSLKKHDTYPSAHPDNNLSLKKYISEDDYFKHEQFVSQSIKPKDFNHLFSKFKDQERRFHNACVLTKSDIERISIEDLKQKIETHPKIILIDNLDSPIASKLNEANAKFVIHYNKLDNVNINTKFLFVTNKEDKKVFDLFSNKANRINNSLLITSKKDLLETLHSKKDNERYITIFNNIDGTIFGEDIQNYNLQEVITCNSFMIENNNFKANSFDYIYINTLIEAIINTQTQSSHYFDEIIFSIADNYNLILRKSNKRNTLVATIGISVGIPTIIFIKNKLN